jgi:hypothetical protein
LVLDVNESGDCELFFMDYGYHEIINYEKLFILPIEFAETFFTAYRVKFSNIPDYDDKEKESKALEIIKAQFEKSTHGIVE